MAYAHKISKPQPVDLAKYDADETGGVEHEAGLETTAQLGQQLSELQELLYAAGTHSVLIVLQGMDTSGKDGTISHVFDFVNPQGVNVASFKQPTPEEVSHDFLWRIHEKAPAKGHMTIFNRSHYEDVLVVRVHDLVPEKVWKKRYEQINNFESLLSADNTIVIKFFLHITKAEQKERLLARENDSSKAYKLSPGDWAERKFWDQYVAAYSEALSKTGAKDAPWYIVPGNHKWYRNLAIAETLVDTLRDYKEIWQKKLQEIGEEQRAALAQMREKDTDSAEDAKTATDAKTPAKSSKGSKKK